MAAENKDNLLAEGRSSYNAAISGASPEYVSLAPDSQ